MLTAKEAVWQEGRVTSWFAEKGFGFITPASELSSAPSVATADVNAQGELETARSSFFVHCRCVQ